MNPNIYCFSLFNVGYSSAHSLIRELFGSPKNICPSLLQGDLLYVLSSNPPVKPLHHTFQKQIVFDKKTITAELETHVAFCNRHRENLVPKKMYSKSALEKFCSLTGLKEEKAICSFLGPHKEQKFNIHNSFIIEGVFNILDHNKINQALTSGLGSRKSYGYGLILTKQRRKYESTN